MGVRIPFFPPEDYGYIAKQLQEEFQQFPSAPEGHISPDQAEFLYHFVRFVRPKFVVETGFDVGHSACVVMYAQRSIGIEPRLMSVDNCHYAETRLAANQLKEKFSRFVFVEGDSKEVLSSAINQYLRENEGLPLDLGLVDGGHDSATVSHDLEVLFSFLSLGGYLWLDDFEKIVPNPGVNLAGRVFARRWGSCHRYRTRGNRGIMLYQKAF